MAEFKIGDRAVWFNFNVVVLDMFEDEDGVYYEVTATDFDAPFPVWVEEGRLRKK